MKDLFIIFETDPKQNIAKNIFLLASLKKIAASINASVTAIVFSESKVLSEKLVGSCSRVVSISGKNVRDFNEEDYYQNIKNILNQYNVFGIYALSSINSEYYLPKLSIDFDIEFIPNCWGISLKEENIIFRGGRYGGRYIIETAVNEKGAVVSFVTVKGIPVTKITADDNFETDYIKYDPVQAELSFDIVNHDQNLYKNKTDISDYKSFIAIGDSFSYEDISEKECEKIAKNITGIKCGDNSALQKGMISGERLLGGFGRSVTSVFLLNFDMKVAPYDVNALLKEGPVITVTNDRRNLYSFFSEYIVETDPEKFAELLAEKLERKIRY